MKESIVRDKPAFKQQISHEERENLSKKTGVVTLSLML
jgi:hypothetical protein